MGLRHAVRTPPPGRATALGGSPVVTWRRMLVLGDSIAWGMSASRPELAWPEIGATQLRACGSAELAVVNGAIPASVISPRNPSYEFSARPSLLERWQRAYEDAEPDLVVVAEATNDIRAGMPADQYAEDLNEIAGGIMSQRSASGRRGVTLVLVGPYPQVYGRGANDPRTFPNWSKWQPPDLETFNDCARKVAQNSGALYVDALQALECKERTLDADCCHLNDLGHRLVGNVLFRTLALI